MTWAQVDEEQDDYYSCEEMSTSSASDDEGKEAAEEAEQPNKDDSDSDVDDEIGRAHGPKTSSEKTRTQYAILRAFAADLSANLTQKEVDEAASKTPNEEQLSIKDILAKQETTIRITNPRDYQTELFQRAKSENVIAVLDTGSGKTHIATLLLRHVLDEELEDRAKGGTHKMSFFLVRLSIPPPTIC
jgi:endoribonuclease Dicer